MNNTPRSPGPPDFSIVTVTLNPGQDLQDTVGSVLNQTHDGFELIIKDGGSTDGTEKLTWNDPRVLRRTSRDAGIFDAMNQALALCRGRLVCFLNAGDVLVDPRVLADVADVVRAHPGIPFFYGDVEKPGSRSGYELYPARLSRRYLFMNTICHQGWFVSAETYRRQGGFETSCGMAADPRLLLRMLVGENMPHVHVPRVVARYKGGGASAKPDQSRASYVSCDALRRELYSTAEYCAWRMLERGRAFAKKTLYDTVGWRVWRIVQRARKRVRPISDIG